MFSKHKQAAGFFKSLAFTHKREYVEWITGAKKEETRQTRLQTTIKKLTAGKKNYNEK
ncbi:MAG: YdeI/OmpD-associated family protein [Chitinophagaceae bacterium]|nr:YdeI/OmpD-associated family protein [Chitinophagaceae bacterium]MBK7306286.1 YdeI/OmpD-associated family protein [Chitinophagaceae bacterium]MBK8787303.1 YdeI/OmpD-associated family protein [Chitinophagaceae bacterium]MBL0201247.1 YdeI/OmpD-associated family protein [Chitinophagaceae bacterium]